MSELYVVSTEQRKPKRSLFERAGSRETHIVDAYLRDRLGGKAVSLVARRLSEFWDDMAIEDERLGSVAGIYRGIEQIIACNQARSQSRFVIGSAEPQKIYVATFSTRGDYDLDISDKLRLEMENNDTSILSLCPRIGIRLDEPVAFDSLVDNLSNEEDETRAKLQSPPTLRIVR